MTTRPEFLAALFGLVWLLGLYLIATGQGDPIAHAVAHLTTYLDAHSASAQSTPTP